MPLSSFLQEFHYSLHFELLHRLTNNINFILIYVSWDNFEPLRTTFLIQWVLKFKYKFIFLAKEGKTTPFLGIKMSLSLIYAIQLVLFGCSCGDEWDFDEYCIFNYLKNVWFLRRLKFSKEICFFFWLLRIFIRF